MYEFDSVSVSTYEAASLAAKLSEKAADGWEVVAIVPAGSDVVAYVKREGTDAAVTDTTTDTVVADVPAADTAATAPSEPSGWGTAPEAAAAAGGAASTWGSTAGTDTGAAGSWGSSSTPAATDTGSGWGSTAATAAAAPAAATAPATPATPSVPAGWYHDPAGRYELRYWDGSAWTEHVSRAGQQYTDPPVA